MITRVSSPVNFHTGDDEMASSSYNRQAGVDQPIAVLHHPDTSQLEMAAFEKGRMQGGEQRSKGRKGEERRG